MKKIITTIFSIVAFVSFGFAQNTPDEIFKKYYEATGGQQLFDNVTTYTLKQNFKNNTSSDYDVAIVASLPDQAMTKTKTILKRDFIYGVNNTDGWLKIPMSSSDKVVKYDTKDLSDNDKDGLKREMKDDLLSFQNYQDKGYIASFVATETVNGNFVQHVELSGKNVKYDLYFDSGSGLLAREKATLSSGEVITRDYTKYAQSTYGISYPSEGTSTSSLDKKTFKLTNSMSFNDKLDFSSFKR